LNIGEVGGSEEKAMDSLGFGNALDPFVGLDTGEPTDNVRLQEELDEARRERSQFKTQLQRAQADFINYRRRIEEDEQRNQRSANARLIFGLLPVLDDIQRAVAGIPTGTSTEIRSWVEGMELVVRKFLVALSDAGAELTTPPRGSFDPLEHELVGYEENEDYPDGEVLHLVRQGYTMNGKVIRPAQVVVNRLPRTADDEC